jgi:hypothetical protein
MARPPSIFASPSSKTSEDEVAGATMVEECAHACKASWQGELPDQCSVTLPSSATCKEFLLGPPRFAEHPIASLGKWHSNVAVDASFSWREPAVQPIFSGDIVWEFQQLLGTHEVAE